MKCVAVVLAILALGFALEEAQTRFLFEEFRAQNNKFYSSPYEAAMRYDIFKHNLDYIEIQNAFHPSTVLGITQFADMTHEEFKAFVALSNFKAGPAVNENTAPVKADLPNDVDWSVNLVAPKNQAQCGSCWAFGSVAALEGLAYVKTGKTMSFSEQQLVDCASECSGCQGGLRDAAFRYVIKAGGVCSESDYPYTAKEGTCKDTSCTKVFSITGYESIPAGNSLKLKEAVTQQVVSVGIEADDSVFQFYTSGIIDHGCGPYINHGVAAVGYGIDNDVMYWKVRNSWGATWGEQGYVRIIRTDNTSGSSMCAVAGRCYYPTKN